MKCHYEVLGVDLDCTSDDLKKAYRKLALEWHPDKNLSRLEEAKENFQLIQQAYEILSDHQERAWYDRHREDILRGDAEEAYKNDSLNIYHYYNSSCYKGYNDGEKGFYTVYRQVFEKIAAEDKPFIDEEEFMEIPQFGCSNSPFEEVHSFYGYWQSYCTAKSFSWIDKYDLSEARKSGVGRQVIRAMEKENKKLRDAQKKLRNEEIRELVAFVRKRDKRVQAQKKLMEEKKAEKAKIAEEKRRQQLEERNKAFENYKETEWSSMSQFEDHFNEIEASLNEKFGDESEEECSNEYEAVDLEDLYCIACEKDFRSEKAFKNHENSKKHKENVALLKELMEEEEKAANKIEEDNVAEENEQETAESANEDVESETSTKDDVPAERESDLEENISSEALLDTLIKSCTKSKKKKKKKKPAPIISKTDNETEPVEVQLNVENIPVADETPVKSTNVNDAKSEKTTKNAKKKTKKDKSNPVKKEISEENPESEKQSTVCGTCMNDFPSRNKLFDHLKSSGHAMIKDDRQPTSTSVKKKGKRK